MADILITSEIDIDAPGKQSGFLRLPHSVHRSAYGWFPLPVVMISNGEGPIILVPCGGGGLTAATAVVMQALSPKTKVYAVEPALFDNTRRSLETRQRVMNPLGATQINGRMAGHVFIAGNGCRIGHHARTPGSAPPEYIPSGWYCRVMRWRYCRPPAVLFTDEGDGIIIQPPVFFDFFDILKENNRRMVTNPLFLKDGRYGMDFDGLERLSGDKSVTMLFLCNPHNPVDRVWSRAELQKLGDICARNNVLVVVDEIHGDITFEGHDYTPFASLGPAYAQNSIACVSPAKSFNITSCSGSFEIIPDVGMIEPDGTFLLWLDFRKLSQSPGDLTTFLREKTGWAVTRGQAFGPEGEGFVRVNIACTRAKLGDAMDQLRAAIKQK